jgi:sodium transport system permease protein
VNLFRVVAAKEIIDNLRDRRTLLSTLMFGPLFAPLMFVVMIQISIDQAISSADELLKVPLVGIASAENLQTFLKSQRIEMSEEHGLTDIDSAAAAVRRGEHGRVVVVDPGYAAQINAGDPARITVVFDRSNRRDSNRVERVQRVLRGYADQIGALRLFARGVNPAVMRPILIDARDISTPTSRSALVLGVLTYFLLFATLMGGMHLAIDSTAGERERKSLEPLLSLPVERSTLLFGKIAATVVFMLLSLALTLVGFVVSMQFMPLDQLGMSSGFTLGTAVVAFFLLLPFALLGAVLMTLVASFTKSIKEAQTYLGLLLLVPTLPVAIASIMNVRATPLLMWVPSMSQHLMITAFIKQEAIQPLMLLQSVVSTLLYVIPLGFVAIKLYKLEALLG